MEIRPSLILCHTGSESEPKTKPEKTLSLISETEIMNQNANTFSADLEKYDQLKNQAHKFLEIRENYVIEFLSPKASNRGAL